MGSQEYFATDRDVKNIISDIPVDACKGWFDPCAYCDKRFGEWISMHDAYGNVPEEEGFIMIALKTKNITEVVNIVYDQVNILKCAVAEIDTMQKHSYGKRSKESKTTILVRWMAVGKDGDTAENGTLCAHWYNRGQLPKFMNSWPGQNILQESKTLDFSKQLQQWCYRKKNPVWRKSKPPPSRIFEVVKKCNLQSCEVCDAYFSRWKSLSCVTAEDLAPEDKGIVMFCVRSSESREIVAIISDKHDVVVSIKNAVKEFDIRKRVNIRSSKFKNDNPVFEVRWMIITNVESDNLCFLYAHWLNADKKPVFNCTHIPGEDILNKNKNFSQRSHDKKWQYEIEAFKQKRVSKSKCRRNIRDLMNEDYFSDFESEEETID